jgi:adenylate kinase family enzyme
MHNHQIIIIIGLPGSGKTMLADKYKEIGYMVFDDFVGNCNFKTIIQLIISGHKLCMNDPRLCLKNVFEHYIKMLEDVIPKNMIFLILFENNKNQCLLNIKKREQENISQKKGVDKVVIRYSNEYKISNYTCYPNIIVKVFIPE